MLGLGFWAIQICLLVIMVAMTARGGCWQQQRRQQSVHVVRLPLPATPAVDWELISFTPTQRARLQQLRKSMRAAQHGVGALQDDIRAH